MKQETQSVVKSADRMADVLEYVAGAAQPPTFSELGQALGLPKSSLFNLLATLVLRGYLEEPQSRTSGYRLGPMIATIARAMDGPPSYANRAQPILQGLVGDINETCAYYEVRDDEVEVIREERSQQALQYLLHAGEHGPLYAMSAGKAVLAFMPQDHIDAYLKRTPLRELTKSTIKSTPLLLNELQQIKQSGFAYSREEYAVGVIAVATPVLVHGKAVGALSVAMPSVRFNDELDAMIRRSLAQAAVAMSRRIG